MARKLKDLLKLDQKEREWLEKERKEAEDSEKAMVIAVMITVVIGLILALVIIASLWEVATWTK